MSSMGFYRSRMLWSICIGSFASCAAMAAGAGPAAPNNAALVYYQALLLCPDASISDVASGTFRGVFKEPNLPNEAREYVTKYDDAIDLVRTASQIEHCDWGMDGLLDAQASNAVATRARYAAFLVCSSARVLAANQDYRSALVDCLVVRRFATHLFKGATLFFAESISVDGWALQCIQQILGMMPPDEPTLAFLREQMASMPVVSDQLWTKYDKSFERDLWRWRTLAFPRIREELLEWASGRTVSHEGLALSDDNLLEIIQEPFVTSVRAVRNILAGGMSYEETHAALEREVKQLRERALAQPGGLHRLYLSASLEGVPHLYNLQLAHRSHLNAILTAIEIYRAVATNGQLPQDLWDALPGDPYSGKTFKYERTKEGFVLRGRVKPTDRNEPWEYRFKVRRPTGRDGAGRAGRIGGQTYAFHKCDEALAQDR